MHCTLAYMLWKSVPHITYAYIHTNILLLLAMSPNIRISGRGLNQLNAIGSRGEKDCSDTPALLALLFNCLSRNMNTPAWPWTW